MGNERGTLFTNEFLSSLRSLIETHHSAYPSIPPHGRAFEDLAERAFRQSGWPEVQVVLSTPNSPRHDLLVGSTRVSLKTETGVGTNPEFITITKLCTTEREPWDSPTLIQRVLEHLSRYDHILLLRAIWPEQRRTIRYQLVEVPIALLRLIAYVTASPVGRRPGRQSLGADVYEGGERVFYVFFDGADGKCQIRRLLMKRCRMLLEWNHRVGV